MQPPLIFGPQPPFNNPPIQPQFYQPSMFFISNIVLGKTTTVTTVVNQNYVIGQLTRLIIPMQSGCRQLNEQEGYVISIPASNQVVLNIDSSENVDPFTSSTASNQPQIVAVGDVNTGFLNSNGPTMTGTSIPGSFLNISP